LRRATIDEQGEDMAATHNDAMLIVALSKLAVMLGVPEAARRDGVQGAGILVGV
jgi:hypothetical protein